MERNTLLIILESKQWTYWLLMIPIGSETDLGEEKGSTSKGTAWCSLRDGSGKDVDDKVGCSQVIQDLEYLAKETEGSLCLSKVIIQSNLYLEITLMP